MKVYWCRVHDSNSESFIARCFYALWANALDRCDLKEMYLSQADASQIAAVVIQSLLPEDDE